MTALPCHLGSGVCPAICCKRGAHGWPYAFTLDPGETFAHAYRLPDEGGGRNAPYLANGNCMFLGDDDRCTIYDQRPNACRRFDCSKDTAFQRATPQIVELLISATAGTRWHMSSHISKGEHTWP